MPVIASTSAVTSGIANLWVIEFPSDFSLLNANLSRFD
jgi:hypothetical protein